MMVFDAYITIIRKVSLLADGPEEAREQAWLYTQELPEYDEVRDVAITFAQTQTKE